MQTPRVSLRMGAQLPPVCGRARGGSVRGHLGCAVGTERTDVAHGLLRLDVRDVARENVPGLGLTDEDVGLLRG